MSVSALNLNERTWVFWTNRVTGRTKITNISATHTKNMCHHTLVV